MTDIVEFHPAFTPDVGDRFFCTLKAIALLIKTPQEVPQGV
ncbi:hypothetical protein [Tolypothrix sp. NIES-4075]|nr:hypothetical protein [Tolypothrix sp. NIES-4075]